MEKEFDENNNEKFLFSSGPTKKFPGWDTSIFNDDLISRNHLSIYSKSRIKAILDKIRNLLQIPKNYSLFFVPGSGNGAMAAAFLNFLQENNDVQVAKSGYFSNEWYKELKEEFNLDVTLVDIEKFKINTDKVVVLCDTMSGYKHENFDKIKQFDDYISILDAVSGAFLEKIVWTKFDVVCFSVQKVLGGDGSIGVIAVNPRAQVRLKNKKIWPIPRLFNINKWDLNEIKNGRFMSTPSILALIELDHILNWIEKIGMEELKNKCLENWKIIDDFVQKNNEKIDYFITDKENRSLSLVCLCLKNYDDEIMEKISKMAANENIFDIENRIYKCWRFWVGPTIEADYLQKALDKFQICLDSL